MTAITSNTPRSPASFVAGAPSDAHHLRFAQSSAFGRKVSDEFTVPLCRGHHRELHRCGNETARWDKDGVDPLASARKLWLKTHPLPATPDDMAMGGAAYPAATIRTEQSEGRHPRSSHKRGKIYNTAPIPTAPRP